MLQLIALFVYIDDFFIKFAPYWNKTCIENGMKRNRKMRLTIPEIMTILMYYHMSDYKTFKAYYKENMKDGFDRCFPIVSYSRFIEIIPRAIVPMYHFLKSKLSRSFGVSFIDSSVLKVCHEKRSKQHKTFRGLATKTKSTMGWLYGFKLHIIVNHKGEIINFKLTKANVDDRKRLLDLTKNIKGILVGDKGYISQKYKEVLSKKDINLITPVRQNMKLKLSKSESRLVKKRGVVESVFGVLKITQNIDHTRHRSSVNFLLNVLTALSAYCLRIRKSSINLAHINFSLA